MSVSIRNVEITTTEQRRVLTCDGPECGNETSADVGAMRMGLPLTWYALCLPETSPEDILHFCGLDCLKSWSALATVDAVYSGAYAGNAE